MYYLLDLGSTLSFVTLFVVVHFSFGPKYISDPFSISTLVGDFVVVIRVYMGCVVSIYSREILVD